MDKLVRPLAGIAIAAAACGITALAGVVFEERTAELRVSLQEVLQRVLGTDTRVTREVLTDAQGTDVSAIWALDLARPRDDVGAWLTPYGFSSLDADDDAQFRKRAEHDLGVALPPGYRAFEAGLTLGRGSVCETADCDVVVVAAPGDSRVYLVISAA